MAKSIGDIKNEFAAVSEDKLPELIYLYAHDERSGVKKLVQAANKRYNAYENELARMQEMFHYERLYPEKKAIAGIDEVGRGPLAGPVVTCAAILPDNCDILYINDSKQLSEKKRVELFEVLAKKCRAFSIGIADHEVIDEINILQATYEAMRQAVDGLAVRPDQLLVDAVTIPGISVDQRGIIKGDAKSASIAAASILAKVTRDRLADNWARIYPGYGFEHNRGYGTKAHLDAIKRLGPCEIHRHSFNPVKSLLAVN